MCTARAGCCSGSRTPGRWHNMRSINMRTYALIQYEEAELRKRNQMLDDRNRREVGENESFVVMLVQPTTSTVASFQNDRRESKNCQGQPFCASIALYYMKYNRCE